MSTGAAAGSRDKESGAYRYQRHQPENTLLYQTVERYYSEFTAYLADQGAVLPRYVQRGSRRGSAISSSESIGNSYFFAVLTAKLILP